LPNSDQSRKAEGYATLKTLPVRSLQLGGCPQQMDEKCKLREIFLAQNRIANINSILRSKPLALKIVQPFMTYSQDISNFISKNDHFGDLQDLSISTNRLSELSNR